MQTEGPRAAPSNRPPRVEASTRKRLRPAHELARKVLLPPLVGGAAVLCLLIAVALSFNERAQAGNPLAPALQDEIARQLSVDLEGAPTPADIRRAIKPLSERQRLLRAHPYYALYSTAREQFGVSRYLVAAVHYQETGFGEAPAKLAEHPAWQRDRDAALGIPRPTRYPNRARRHPSVKDDFDVVMAIAAGLKRARARDVGPVAQRAVATRYGQGPEGRLATAMVIERARAWRLLGTIPLPGSGELAIPVEGVVGGCGYFGCPRPGHLHNGVDFLAPTGTPVHAVGEGIVAVLQSPGASGGYGNFACIQHRPNLASCYAHMSAFAAGLRAGDYVKRGQVIGLVGSTGRSSAPHLHFEVRRGSARCSACAVDPLPLLSGEVPDAILPQMASIAPRSARASATAAPALATAPPPTADRKRGADPGAPVATTRGRNRSARGEKTTGGETPSDPAPARTTPAPPPAGTTAPTAPRAPAAQQPPPQPAGPQTATGGTVPTAAPAPAAQPPPPAPPPPPPDPVPPPDP